MAGWGCDPKMTAEKGNRLASRRTKSVGRERTEERGESWGLRRDHLRKQTMEGATDIAVVDSNSRRCTIGRAEVSNGNE